MSVVTPSFYISTDCACIVALAARGLAASRLLRLIDNSTVAGVRDFLSLGPALMMGDSRGMQTRASISSTSAAADDPGGVRATSAEADDPCGDRAPPTGPYPADGLASSNSMMSQTSDAVPSPAATGLPTTSPKSWMGLRRTPSPLMPGLASMRVFKERGPRGAGPNQGSTGPAHDTAPGLETARQAPPPALSGPHGVGGAPLCPQANHLQRATRHPTVQKSFLHAAAFGVGRGVARRSHEP